VPGVLGETFRLLAAHLHLFTLLVLTVWLPGHVVLNYLEFFGPAADPTFRSLRVAFFLQAIFDPLVVASIVSSLARVKVGLPVPYVEALVEGLRAWPRLVFVRFVIYLALAVPIAVGLALGRPGHGGVAGSLIGLALGCRAAPELNPFVVRVLVDCALSVGQSAFPIALFLFYWRARG
jgi:hypothetical protein